jgi:hypothetical protein
MLWKYFKQQECCDGCPLLENELCSGDIVCYGGEPIEPPCCVFDDDTDMDKWVDDMLAQKLRREEAEDKRLKAEQEKKERAKKAADTRRAMRWYCRDEIQTLKKARKALEAQRALESFVSSFAEAINFANEMFRYEERVGVKPEVSAEVLRLEAEVESAKEAYDSKREQFYAERKNKQMEVSGND